jgi:hypothetical protein
LNLQAADSDIQIISLSTKFLPPPLPSSILSLLSVPFKNALEIWSQPSTMTKPAKSTPAMLIHAHVADPELVVGSGPPYAEALGLDAVDVMNVSLPSAVDSVDVVAELVARDVRWWSLRPKSFPIA